MRNSIIIFLFISTGVFAQVDSFPYFNNHTNDITNIIFSPDDKYILTSSWDETVVINRNDPTCDTVQVLRDFKGAVNTMAFSRDGYKLIAGGQDGILNMYTFSDSFFILANMDDQLLLNNAQIEKLIYGPGMRIIFSAGSDGRFIIYDLVKETPKILKGNRPISAAAVAIDRMSYFIANDGSPLIQQFNIFGKLLNTFEGHSNDISDLLVTVDRKYLISSSKDKTIKIWNIANAKVDHTFTDHTWSVTDIDMDPFGLYLVSGSLDGTVHLYDLKARTTLNSYTLTGFKVNAVALSPSNTTIAAAAQPTGVTNPAGFFTIPTGLQPRKIVLPAVMDLEPLIAKEQAKEQAKKDKQVKKESKEKPKSTQETNTKPDKQANKESVLEISKQVKITIKNNE
jgi:WD40 repeat protein